MTRGTPSTSPTGSPAPLLPKEVAALIHHVELNRAGWWDKAQHRLVLAAVWLSDHNPTADEIRNNLNHLFRLQLGADKVSAAVDALKAQDLLIQLTDNTYRIPDAKRGAFEKDIAEAEKAAADARSFFLTLAKEKCPGLDANAMWGVFDSEFLVPLIAEVGANAYRLIAGERMTGDKSLADAFFARFPPEHQSKLNELVTAFLDPKMEEVRAHISRMLHARFCVEASGLSQDVVDKLRASVGKPIRFRVLVDTNFLFSLLELHENPSNAAACEVQELIAQLKRNPQVMLFVAPVTIEEAKRSIAYAKAQLSGIPSGRNFTQAALHIGLSGLALRFLTARQSRTGSLSAADWFDPYLTDFVPLARAKGVELLNEKLDGYSMRQDVIDDISLVMKYEEKLPHERRKSYEKVAHDMILWHFANDKRGAYVESPLDAHEWILTIDSRLIGFDSHKQRQAGAKVPLCLYPTSFIQLLQFWVPRTREFEEAMLGSLRLPFLFQPFDPEAERTSLRILKGLARFAGNESIPEEALTRVVLNDGLRSRLTPDQSAEAESALIRDALVDEMKSRVEAEASRAQQLETALKERDAAIHAVDAEKRARDEEIQRLRTAAAEAGSRLASAHETLAAQGIEIGALKANWEKTEEVKQRFRAVLYYAGLLTAVIAVSVIAAWQTPRFLPALAYMMGPTAAMGFVAVLSFIIGHSVLEWMVPRNHRMTQIWPFKQTRRFRRWLWTVVIAGFVVGLIGNLYANQIQKKLDQGPAPDASLEPVRSGEQHDDPMRDH